MTKSNNAATGQYKQPYRIFAESTDYLIADIWADNEDEAWDLARQLNSGEFRLMSGDWRIDHVCPFDGVEGLPEPFQPIN